MRSLSKHRVQSIWWEKMQKSASRNSAAQGNSYFVLFYAKFAAILCYLPEVTSGYLIFLLQHHWHKQALLFLGLSERWAAMLLWVTFLKLEYCKNFCEEDIIFTAFH